MPARTPQRWSGFAAKLRAAGVAVPSVGVGSTPTCSRPPDNLDGVDEMHPGNFIYYDVMQAGLGYIRANWKRL